MNAAAIDRLAGAFLGLARGADPSALYRARYRAKLVKQHPSKKRVDVIPEDRDLLPPMSNIPLKVGVPGVDLELKPGHAVLVGWENGRPDRPYVTDWESGADDAIPLKLALRALAVDIGGDGTAPLVESVLIGDTMSAAFDQFMGAMLAGVLALQGASTDLRAPLKPGFAAMQAAIQAFQDQSAGANGFKSRTVKVGY